MSRFLITSFFALTLLISAAPAVHAQTDLVQEPPGSEQITTPENDAGLVDVPPGTPDPAAAAAPNAYKGDATTDSQFGFVMTKIMTLFAWLVGVAALLLDNAVYYTVVTMGAYVNKLSAIGVTWRILRDIANIMLIFGFLGAGIATILNVDQYGWKTKMLPMLFVGAIFLNFSLFITEAMIDGTNLFATQFYQQINGGQPAGVKSFDPGFSVRLRTEGISNKLMSQLGLQTIYGEASTNKEIFKAGNTWVIGFMAILLFIVTAFVMFALAFILIARFVALVFFIILSPVGFMGLAIPQMQYRAKQWWTHFLEQIITAPILMLLLYVALAVITDAQFLTGLCVPGQSTITGAVNTNTTCTANVVGWVSGNFAGFASFILSFLVAMGLLLVVVMKAKSMSAFGAAGATKLAGKLTFGATAWGGRTSGGWLANRGAKYLRKTWVGRVPLAGTGLVRGLDKVASSSFDVRGIKAGGGLGALKVDAGEAQKGGYKADLKARTESRTKYAGELKGRELNDDEKAEQAYWQKEIKKLENSRKNAKDVPEMKKINAEIKEIEKKQLERIEKGTDKDLQRKYATVLELGLNPKGTFNTTFNFAANTDAAREIREKVKKAKPDKDWTSNMKNLLKEAAEESGEDTGTEKGSTTPPSSAPTTPSSGSSTAASGGVTPPTH